MQRLDEFVAKRHAVADRYDYLLADLPLQTPVRAEDSYSAFHLYVIRLNLLTINKPHSQIFEFLRKVGIGVNLHYIPVYHHPYYKELGFNEGYCAEAENYYSEAISLPLYPNLTAAEQDKVVVAVREAIAS
jgi:dTDP-4-amino-4,6-dideoxygalactose transaminase